ncbi:hypothetical protein L6164_013524 [Bauhinia variegata]|uniref:Uncharacterized protein n=1 Tax=Bauhinia variegata TaxID=167791 RepID=A0ACB9NFD1_BAUVA|nr:hypothetical protein L6164_013524 [Bauhinia variegata]
MALPKSQSQTLRRAFPLSLRCEREHTNPVRQPCNIHAFHRSFVVSQSQSLFLFSVTAGSGDTIGSVPLSQQYLSPLSIVTSKDSRSLIQP